MPCRPRRCHRSMLFRYAPALSAPHRAEIAIGLPLGSLQSLLQIVSFPNLALEGGRLLLRHRECLLCRWCGSSTRSACFVKTRCTDSYLVMTLSKILSSPASYLIAYDAGSYEVLATGFDVLCNRKGSWKNYRGLIRELYRIERPMGPLQDA